MLEQIGIGPWYAGDRGVVVTHGDVRSGSRTVMGGQPAQRVQQPVPIGAELDEGRVDPGNDVPGVPSGWQTAVRTGRSRAGPAG